MVKVILAQPAIPRFQWELEVLLTNITQWVDPHDIILLFSKPHDFVETVPSFLVNKYGVQSFLFPDGRDDKSYIPSIRPYLWWQFLMQDHSRQNETYFYIDSDVVFKEWIDFATLDFSPTKWLGSNCRDYISGEYILQCDRGPEIVERMAQITGITRNDLMITNGAGAQWIIDHPTIDFWQRAYEDSNRIHNYLQDVNSNIQKWTAEMWAQLFGMTREGIKVEMPAELDFCMSTDPIERWGQVKILHNAGITAQMQDCFFKGGWIDKSPLGRDWSHITKEKCTSKYVEALQKVVL